MEAMTVTAGQAPAVRKRSAMLQLTITELKLFARGRAAVGLGLSLGVPLLLVIIFGGIHSFKAPVKVYGGLTTLDVYVPILLVFALALLSLVAMPATLAGYRELGVLRRLKTTPAGPVLVLAAQLTVKLAVAVVIVAVAWLGSGVAAPRQLGGFVVAVLFRRRRADGDRPVRRRGGAERGDRAWGRSDLVLPDDVLRRAVAAHSEHAAGAEAHQPRHPAGRRGSRPAERHVGALAGRAAAGDHGGLRGAARTGRCQAVPLGVKSLGGEDR